MQAIKTQWHPAFCAAIKLELAADKGNLEYINEYNLTSKPLQIDLLIIKKLTDSQVKNEVGRIFRGHNIMEYKSTEDKLNVNTFIKVVAYACLYKVSEKRIGEIRLEDITLTLIREKYPRKLFKWFRKHGYMVEERYAGIFYITGVNFIITQVIVLKKLSKENQKWLTLLNKKLDEQDAKRAVKQTSYLITKEEKDLADAVMQVAISKNAEKFYGAKEGDEMSCEALRKLMKPELEAAKAEGRAEVRGEMQKIIDELCVKNEMLQKQLAEVCQKECNM